MEKLPHEFVEEPVSSTLFEGEEGIEEKLSIEENKEAQTM